MSEITRRTVLAGLPAIATVAPAAAAPSPLRPSDPAIAARWAELFQHIVQVTAVSFRPGRTARDAEDEQPAIDAMYERVHAFEKQLWATPVRSFGDVVLRMAVARYWAAEDRDGRIVEPYRDDDSFQQSVGHLVLGVMQLAGLPTDNCWQQALAGTVEGHTNV